MINIKIPEFDYELFNVECYKDLKVLPEGKPGIYIMHGEECVLYVGKAENVRMRVRKHLQGNSNLMGKITRIAKLEVFFVDNLADRSIYEIYLIKTLQPLLNKEYLEKLK